MAYGFNDDKSKVEVYSKAEIDNKNKFFVLEKVRGDRSQSLRFTRSDLEAAGVDADNLQKYIVIAIGSRSSLGGTSYPSYGEQAQDESITVYPYAELFYASQSFGPYIRIEDGPGMSSGLIIQVVLFKYLD